MPDLALLKNFIFGHALHDVNLLALIEHSHLVWSLIAVALVNAAKSLIFFL